MIMYSSVTAGTVNTFPSVSVNVYAGSSHTELSASHTHHRSALTSTSVATIGSGVVGTALSSVGAGSVCTSSAVLSRATSSGAAGASASWASTASTSPPPIAPHPVLFRESGDRRVEVDQRIGTGRDRLGERAASPLERTFATEAEAVPGRPAHAVERRVRRDRRAPFVGVGLELERHRVLTQRGQQLVRLGGGFVGRRHARWRLGSRALLDRDHLVDGRRVASSVRRRRRRASPSVGVGHDPASVDEPALPETAHPSTAAVAQAVE